MRRSAPRDGSCRPQSSTSALTTASRPVVGRRPRRAAAACPRRSRRRTRGSLGCPSGRHTPPYGRAAADAVLRVDRPFGRRRDRGGDLVEVEADPLRDEPHLVPEADLRGVEDVVRALDQLGLGRVRRTSAAAPPNGVSSRREAGDASARPAPMTVIHGLRKSCSAEAARRNSGLAASPKPRPATLPEVRSSTGRTSPSVVPGGTVDRTTTVCRMGDVARRPTHRGRARRNACRS